MISTCREEINSSLHCIICEDGSQTFFNTKYNEAYHSKIGPITEARHKFVNPSCLEELIAENKKVRILDLFFGLGYNTGITLDTAYKISNNPQIEIVAIEKDIEIIRKIQDLEVPDWYKKWRDFLGGITNQITSSHENISITLCLECIFNAIEKLPNEYFDIIYFDPFSHKVTPEFWTDNFLKSVFKLLTQGGTLTTYSGLKRVAKLACEEGFIVRQIEPIGRKKNSLAIVRKTLY